MLANPLLVIRKIIENKVILGSFEDRYIIYSSSRNKGARLETLSYYRGSNTNKILFGRNNYSESIVFGWRNIPTIILMFDNDFTINLYENSSDYVGNLLFEIDKNSLNDDNIFQLTLEYGLRKVYLEDDQYKIIFGFDE